MAKSCQSDQKKFRKSIFGIAPWALWCRNFCMDQKKIIHRIAPKGRRTLGAYLKQGRTKKRGPTTPTNGLFFLGGRTTATLKGDLSQNVSKFCLCTFYVENNLGKKKKGIISWYCQGLKVSEKKIVFSVKYSKYRCFLTKSLGMIGFLRSVLYRVVPPPTTCVWWLHLGHASKISKSL